MKLLVFGRTGQLAQSLLARHGQSGIEIIAVGRPDADLSESQSLTAAIEKVSPNIVVNAAAYTGVDQAETDQDQAKLINELGAGYVAAVCEAYGCPLIHVSTDYVFDGTKSAPYTELDPVAPLGVYGHSKYAGEQRVAELCPQHVILRTAWLHSPYGQNFVKTMLRLASERPDINVVNDQIGSPTYAPHLAEAICTITQQIHRNADDRLWGVYHAAGEGQASWFDVAKETFAVSKRQGGPSANVHPIPSSDYPTPAQRPANSRLDCGKLKSRFNAALPCWTSGVAECVAHLLAQTNVQSTVH